MSLKQDNSCTENTYEKEHMHVENLFLIAYTHTVYMYIVSIVWQIFEFFKTVILSRPEPNVLV